MLLRELVHQTSCERISMKQTYQVRLRRWRIARELGRDFAKNNAKRMMRRPVHAEFGMANHHHVGVDPLVRDALQYMQRWRSLWKAAWIQHTAPG